MSPVQQHVVHKFLKMVPKTRNKTTGLDMWKHCEMLRAGELLRDFVHAGTDTRGGIGTRASIRILWQAPALVQSGEHCAKFPAPTQLQSFVSDVTLPRTVLIFGGTRCKFCLNRSLSKEFKDFLTYLLRLMYTFLYLNNFWQYFRTSSASSDWLRRLSSTVSTLVIGTRKLPSFEK